MKNYISILCLTVIVGLSSCNPENKEQNAASAPMEVTSQKKKVPFKAEMDKADSLIARTITAHGGERYDTAHYGFKFRDKNYTFHHKKGGYTYTSTGPKDGHEIRDVLDNGTLTRTVDGVTVELSPKEVAKYTEALNSVVYFACLPHKLKDAAVNRTYEGQIAIKGQDYEVLAVTFDQKGGGEDHSDEFRYWIDRSTKTMDYLAYNYETNDGGVRFRSAYGPRTVGGIRFQNYINYEAPIGTPLHELPGLYEAGELKELSKIVTEDVVVIEE